uniref:Tail tubular protein B n=1 Tax=uncultured marine virus TaxID=186617 RepID=A0A0F7LCT6_9VIRU|nr:tail tubular protein B [uncultured marine virus]
MNLTRPSSSHLGSARSTRLGLGALEAAHCRSSSRSASAASIASGGMMKLKQRLLNLPLSSKMLTKPVSSVLKV